MDRGEERLGFATREKELVWDVMGCVPADHILAYREGWFFSSHSWHFLTVPPYSQYYHVRVSMLAQPPRLRSRMSQARRGLLISHTSGGKEHTAGKEEHQSIRSKQSPLRVILAGLERGWDGTEPTYRRST